MDTANDLRDAALDYVRRGFALTWMAHGSKAPTHAGWNTPDRVATTAEQVSKVWNGTPRNIGIVHGLGRVKTCSLDADKPDYTRTALAEFGIDIDALRVGVPCVVGNPQNFRLLFRQPEGITLKTVKLEWPSPDDPKTKVTIFELRAERAQDVLPPSLHPSGNRYRWETPLPASPDDHPTLPATLIELWTHWDAWLPALRAACPWAQPPIQDKPRPREARPHIDIIGQFNSAHDVRQILEAHGYKPRGKSRYLPPNSTSGVPSVRILEGGTVYSSNGSCPLNDGHAHDAFSVFTVLAHGGDLKSALKGAASLLGIELKPSTDTYRQAYVEVAPEAPPDPLRRAPIPAEPYPVAALGPILAPALEVIQRTIQAPVPLIAQSLLGAAALAAQPHANVVIDGRVAPLSLFLITIGASGERKTGVDSLVLKPIQARQRELVDAHKIAMSEHKTASRIWEQAEAAVIKEKVVDLGKVRQTRKEKEEALKALGEVPPEPPLLPNLLVGDPTSEGLFKLFANGQPSLGLFSDEGALFVGGHALARDARLRTIGALSKLWDGRPLDRVRGGDGASILYDRRLSLHLLMQPLVAVELLADPIYQDQGFLARTLLSWPESTAGKRPYVDCDPYQEAAIGRYWRALTDLLYDPPALREGTRNELTPRSLRLAPDAKAEWISYFNAIEKAQAPGGPLEPIRAFASKAAEHAARLAGVLTLVTHPHAMEIDRSNMQCAILLMEYYVTEALRIHDSGIADPQLQAAQRLLDWLHGLKNSHIYLVKVYQHGPSGIRDAKTAKPLLDILVKHRWLAKIDDGMVIDGKFRKEAWRILGKEIAV